MKVSGKQINVMLRTFKFSILECIEVGNSQNIGNPHNDTAE